jgi:hypothetical protein
VASRTWAPLVIRVATTSPAISQENREQQADSRKARVGLPSSLLVSHEPDETLPKMISDKNRSKGCHLRHRESASPLNSWGHQVLLR